MQPDVYSILNVSRTLFGVYISGGGAFPQYIGTGLEGGRAFGTKALSGYWVLDLAIPRIGNVPKGTNDYAIPHDDYTKKTYPLQKIK